MSKMTTQRGPPDWHAEFTPGELALLCGGAVRTPCPEPEWVPWGRLAVPRFHPACSRLAYREPYYNLYFSPDVWGALSKRAIIDGIARLKQMQRGELDY